MQLWCATLILAIAFVASQAEAGCFSISSIFRNKETRPDALKMLNKFLVDHLRPEGQPDVGIEATLNLTGFDVVEADQCPKIELPVEEYLEIMSALAVLMDNNSEDASRCSRWNLTNLKVLYEALKRSERQLEYADSLMLEYLTSIQQPCYNYLVSEWNQKLESSIREYYESFLDVFDVLNLSSYGPERIYPAGNQQHVVGMVKGAIERGKDWENRRQELINKRTLRTMVWGDPLLSQMYDTDGKHEALSERLMNPCGKFISNVDVRNVLDPLAILIELTGLENSNVDHLSPKNRKPFVWLARLLSCQQLMREGHQELYLRLTGQKLSS